MTEPNFDRLSEREKQCLRLYYANLEIKEIAAELGLSPNTVKEHLRDARRLLHASRSIQAARLLVTYEEDTCGVSPPSRIGLERNLSDEAGAAELSHQTTVRNRYGFGTLQRVGLIVAIALAAVALAGALLVGAEAITRIFRAEGINLSDFPN